MRKERSQLSVRRKELIRPEVFEDFDWFPNFQARELVSKLRGAVVKREQERLSFTVPLFKKPYFAYQLEWPYSIKVDIAYLNKKDDRNILHRDRAIIHYNPREVDRFNEFIEAMRNGTIYSIDCELDSDPETGGLPIFIDPKGNISLSGVKIPHWQRHLT